MKQRLKALLLAAGLGTRLRPLTDSIPKCLVEVNGIPVIEHWLRALEAIDCEEVMINTHYLSDQVEAYLRNRSSSFAMKIFTSYEAELLGTAGSLIANSGFFKSCTGLLIHCDNATDLDLCDLVNEHNRRPVGCDLTMLTFTTSCPSSCGIVQVDSQGILKSFYEKVSNPPGNRANGAVYVFDQLFLEKLCQDGSDIVDFSCHVIPRFIGKIYTCHTKNKFIDIGSPAMLREAQLIWSNSDLRS